MKKNPLRRAALSPSPAGEGSLLWPGRTGTPVALGGGATRAPGTALGIPRNQ